MALIPGYIDVNGYVAAAIVPFFRRLEDGELTAYFAPTKTFQQFMVA